MTCVIDLLFLYSNSNCSEEPIYLDDCAWRCPIYLVPCPLRLLHLHTWEITQSHKKNVKYSHFFCFCFCFPPYNVLYQEISLRQNINLVRRWGSSKYKIHWKISTVKRIHKLNQHNEKHYEWKAFNSHGLYLLSLNINWLVKWSSTFI